VETNHSCERIVNNAGRGVPCGRAEIHAARGSGQNDATSNSNAAGIMKNAGGMVLK
jgi:hypothetical protein